jgi:broad specificity phosphatase PhoE
MTGTAPAPATAMGSAPPLIACGVGAFTPWTPAVDGAFPFRTLPGFFLQGDVATESPAHYAPRLGLLPKQKWSDVTSTLDAHDAKLVIFLRHGEGLHNADKARVGDAAWEHEYQFRTDYIDAPLTQSGVDQAVDAGKMLHQELQDGGLALDLVVVSPLERTLDTYKHAWGQVQSSAPVVAMEIVRETLGVCPCDQRKATTPKREAFPEIDFCGVVDEQDPWWKPDHRESDDEIDARARRFLQQIMVQRGERRVLVVSHSGFTRACLRALGHRYYRPANGELVPVLVHVPRDAKHNEEL